MYPGDARAKWPTAALTDPRVQHRWDETRALGLQYLARVPAMLDRRVLETRALTVDAMWDAFFLYALGDAWQDPLPLPVSWGYLILVTWEHLASQLDALLAR